MICLQNVTSAYTLEISSNALLASFQGSFSSLEVDGDTVAIKSNPSLRSLTGLEVTSDLTGLQLKLASSALSV